MGQAQLRLFSADDEAATYHDTARQGFFSLLVATGEGKKQDSYRLSQMPEVLGMLDPSRDTWLSQAEFTKPNRRVVNLARIGLLFADLDTYRQPWAAGRTPEQLAAAVLFHCAQEGIPAPSLLVYSGRGIQAKWLLDGTIPRQALPRWNACQRYLVDRLAGMGADPQAKDASRVLRLVNTVNTKNGNVCRVVHVEAGQDGEPIRYSFEYLAEMLLPVARWTIEQQRRDRAERRQLKLLPGGKADNLRGFSGRQLAWDRLEDLRKLAELRGGVREGERMQHLFWRLNFLLLSGATHSGAMYHEAAALAAELDPSWSYRSKELMTLYAKAKAYEAGEKVTLGGKEFAPLYTPKNDTLISLFHITDDEQRKLRTLISRDMAAERHRKRDEARRRAAGAVDRATYLEAASAKQAQALALKAQGLSVRAIAAQMGVSVGAVSGYLKAGKGVQSPCVLQAAAGDSDA
ncbi:replication protein (plasmid) [Burkholderia multivorans]|uniref:helix-turn-helix transcriptional regulator n=1 Tax=Burkholderia multivorans TaxID=87883 RepID=UPI00201951E8|nr:replication protein [Burkholderia multivorans]MCO1374689.1 replication protein [Burkholderia multivorans]MCO1460004.1 replication protein [Burkholderia multivorans]MCO1470795.1 replication protein [Burkholderia multivorans]UQO21373.1 replication protein [Burkholderia multivorans]UQO87513.1 replication protein [Burkholderia multivorans]